MNKGETASTCPTGVRAVEGRTTGDLWSEVHLHLESARTMVEKGFVLTAEKKKEILKARAKALAQKIEEGETAEDCIEVVEFLLGSEKYAIESTFVREVLSLKEITPLPCTPPFVLGIINVRGQILSVIDIKSFFDLPVKGRAGLNRVILLHSDGMELAILADAVTGTRSFQLKDIQPPLPTLTGIRADYLRGVTNERLVVIDVSKLLSDKRIIVHEEVEA